MIYSASAERGSLKPKLSELDEGYLSKRHLRAKGAGGMNELLGRYWEEHDYGQHTIDRANDEVPSSSHQKASGLGSKRVSAATKDFAEFVHQILGAMYFVRKHR